MSWHEKIHSIHHTTESMALAETIGMTALQAEIIRHLPVLVFNRRRADRITAGARHPQAHRKSFSSVLLVAACANGT